MAQTKFDGVVQAVKYDPNGQILWVRAFLRRGSTWSDHVLLERQALVEQIKSGKRFVFGKRIPLFASTFEILAPINLIEIDGQEVLVTGDTQANKDCLEGVPLL